MKKNEILKTVFDNIKTIIYALIIALIIRSFLFQPFYIPSSSMEPNLLIGDRIFVSKYSYGVSKHSFPFSPPISVKRFFYKSPEQGDLVVFKTPADNRTDYIKRLIGLPCDTIQFKKGEIFINQIKVKREEIDINTKINCGPFDFKTKAYKETLPNGKSYVAVYNLQNTLLNTDVFLVPKNHFFLMGDNRDCSKDSRFLSSVGYVNYLNLVGRAEMIFFSNNTLSGSVLKFWNWSNSLRFNRFFKKI